jgi:hypothetical protein
MSLRDSIVDFMRGAAPFAVLVLFLVLAAAAIVLLPGRGAAALLGIAAGGLLGFSLSSRARDTVKIAVLWAVIGIIADAAYARLNDQAPVTVANALTKIVDAGVKLADPVIRGVGLTAGDPRVKTGAVAPDFIWAFLLTLVVVIAIAFPRRTANRGFSRPVTRPD